MKSIKTSLNRRSFLKVGALTGGGLMLQFNAFATPSAHAGDEVPAQWFEMNAHLAIGNDGQILIRVPKPEFGQNLMTSLPMIVADELDVDWESVKVEMAPFDMTRFQWQFSGGSQSVRSSWETLRMAGASARQMLRSAAARQWGVPVAEVTAVKGVLAHEGSGNTAGYGEFAAAAAALEVPKEVSLKTPEAFGLIGTAQKNVLGKEIVTGARLFNGDSKREGMLYATVVHPPAFGLTLKSFDAASVKGLPGVRDVFAVSTYNDGYVRNYFDTNAFPDVVAIVGDSTWQLFKAAKQLKAEWVPFAEYSFEQAGFTGDVTEQKVPAGLESTSDHNAWMDALLAGTLTEKRRDGDPDAAFANAAQVIERTYSAPYLAHNMMEPLNYFADVSDGKAYLEGPIQGAMFIVGTVAERLGMPKEQIEIKFTRMGGGFGRRAYAHYAVEAALISKQVGAPVMLQYSREQCHTQGNFRPTYKAQLRAALDDKGNMTAYHVRAVGVPDSPVFENRFPAGAVANYLAEGAGHASNITVAAFRAPNSNFMAGAEQSFLDEVAEAAGKDPIEFRLELLKRAQKKPVGDKNDYDAARYAAVIELARKKSNWMPGDGARRGFAAYYCHNSYAAHVMDTRIQDGFPLIDKVCTAVDCGQVVNTEGARNMVEGATIDGIGNALFGELSFEAGVPQTNNLNVYRMIRLNEAPSKMEVFFVNNGISPTGLGEPPFPPAFGAVANALHKATGRRVYQQPYIKELMS